MPKTPRILILEDQETDAELALRELRQAGVDCEYKRVDTKELFVKELHEFEPDLILSDYSLPRFTGLNALRLLKELSIKTPFVLYTGSLTEEVAVECMKEGATDYILKSSLKRLPGAVLNALEASASRHAKEEALDALRRSEFEFRSIVETTNEWIWALDLEGRITYSNPAVQRILGYSDHEVLGRSIFEFLHPEDADSAQARFWSSISAGTGWSQSVTRFRDVLGNIRYLESNGVPAQNAEGRLIGYRGSDRDITERKAAEDRLLHDAFHDALTGLPNRPLFMTHLDLTCKQDRTDSAGRFAVVLLDVDRFKIINDSLGYVEGDNLLKLLAERLRGALRPGDVVARLGGDEFTLLLTRLDAERDALRAIDRIRNSIHSAPFELNGREVFVTVSAGVAFGQPGRNNAEDLLRGADSAMYRAKGRALAQLEIFEPSMHQHVVTQLQLETEIRLGLKNREFYLLYQPIVDLVSPQILGFEALVRWNHPTRGIVSPLDFIGAAEESGLILPLGRWVLEESCKQLREWQESEPATAALTMSVNISAKQFIQHDLADQIAGILAETGLGPGSLKVEVTESHLITNTDAAIEILNRLRDLGISISIDDFGTGYSSLSYLHRLPVHYLKIDRSFVRRMADSQEHAEIVSTIIRLAANLRLKTIAEGIETPEQLELLRALNCDFGQGYLFARPLPPDEAAEWIRSTPTSSVTLRDTVDDPSLALRTLT